MHAQIIPEPCILPFWTVSGRAAPSGCVMCDVPRATHPSGTYNNYGKCCKPLLRGNRCVNCWVLPEFHSEMTFAECGKLLRGTGGKGRRGGTSNPGVRQDPVRGFFLWVYRVAALGVSKQMSREQYFARLAADDAGNFFTERLIASTRMAWEADKPWSKLSKERRDRTEKEVRYAVGKVVEVCMHIHSLGTPTGTSMHLFCRNEPQPRWHRPFRGNTRWVRSTGTARTHTP